MSPIPAAPSRARRSIARARKVPATMKTAPDQLSLPLFDTTALTSSMGLYSGLSFGELADDLIETEEDTPAPVVIQARNFRLTSARRLAPEWKARAADNIAAIRLMLEIEEEARNALPDELERLALFTSFGAGDLANNLFRRSRDEVFPKGWETLGEELEELVSPAELTSLARVTQYAHFTPEFMVRAIWRALSRTGFSGGRVLEPGCGTGLFFALMPEALEDKTTLTGVEMDPVTARIAKLLHPNARIRAEDFTKARIAETYDLVIGNPPFSSRTVRADDPAGLLSLSLHDYFIARSIERLRPGRLAAFVTSRWTMDKADPTARTFLENLEGYVRSPARGLGVANGRPHISRIERSRRSMHAARGVSDEMLDGQVRLGGTFRHIWASGNIAISPHSNYKDLSEYRHNRSSLHPCSVRDGPRSLPHLPAGRPQPKGQSQRRSMRHFLAVAAPHHSTRNSAQMQAAKKGAFAALCSILHHQYICGGEHIVDYHGL